MNHLETPNVGSEPGSPGHFRQKSSQMKDPFGGGFDHDVDQDEIEDLFKEDNTPALFRGNSGMIDPNTLKRK